MLPDVDRALEGLAVAGCRVLVAVSGGIDSTVLAHAFATLAEARQLEITLAHVNHGLRAEADADARHVRALGRALRVPVCVRDVEPGRLREGVASRARPTVQEAARTLRRAALAEMCAEAGARYVATAHQADDQAETVLMRILRGCGPDSIGGIPEKSPDGIFVRPLLGVARSEIEAYAREHGLAWREDRSNEDPRYTRSRIRHALLPALARDYNPQLLRVVGDLAEAQRRDAEWLETLVASEAERRFLHVGEGGAHTVEIEADGWRELPEALARRLVRRLLTEMGGGRDVTRVHLLRVLDFLREGPHDAAAGRPEPVLELPDGLRLSRTAGAFLLRRFAGAVSKPGDEND